MMNDRSERIRFAIARKKLSYTELERLTGVSKSALQRYASVPLIQHKMEGNIAFTHGWLLIAA